MNRSGDEVIIIKTYFIDSENVGDAWTVLLEASGETDRLLVFYTDNSPHMSYKSLRLLYSSARSVQFIECFSGNNGLDFQLVGELGFRLHDIGEQEYVIVSNDTGFDAAVRYWVQAGYAVRRLSGKDCLRLKRHELPAVAAPASSEPAAAEPAANASAGSDALVPLSSPVMNCTAEGEPAQPAPQTVVAPSEPAAEAHPAQGHRDSAAESSGCTVDTTAKELLYLIGKEKLSDLHSALQKFYDNKRASAIYKAFFTTEGAYAGFLARHEKLDTAEKQQAYCALVFAQAASGETMPKDFSEFVTSSWSKKPNLNSLRAGLMSRYGKEKGERYYSIIKTHVKILEIIKS